MFYSVRVGISLSHITMMMMIMMMKTMMIDDGDDYIAELSDRKKVM